MVQNWSSLWDTETEINAVLHQIIILCAQGKKIKYHFSGLQGLCSIRRKRTALGLHPWKPVTCDEMQGTITKLQPRRLYGNLAGGWCENLCVITHQPSRSASSGNKSDLTGELCSFLSTRRWRILLLEHWNASESVRVCVCLSLCVCEFSFSSWGPPGGHSGLLRRSRCSLISSVPPAAVWACKTLKRKWRGLWLGVCRVKSTDEQSETST